MSARNVKKYAERGSLLIENCRQDDLSTDEMLKLLQAAHDPGDAESIMNAITAAFYMGYAVGYDRRGRAKITTVGEYKKAMAAAGI